MSQQFERDKALSEGRRKAAARRVVTRRKQGRPPKPSGVYYTHPILVDEDMFRILQMHKLHHEPLGSVLHRIWKEAQAKQKKAEALEQELKASVDDPVIWDYLNNKETIKGIPVYRQGTLSI